MAMLFENALYYPTIDINDETWLKSAVLLWDTISTIVPETEIKPYKHEWSKAFAQADIITPHMVNPNSVNFHGLDVEVRAFLDSPEGRRSFKPNVGRRNDYRNYNELIREVQLSDVIWRNYGEFKISVEKFGYNLQDVIKEYVDDDGYVIASETFMNFYMTSLANNISQQGESKALLTDLPYARNLTDSMMQQSPNERMSAEQLNQGLMYKFIIEGMKINPNTPVDKLIKFREEYKGERDLFKYEIANLIKTVNIEGLPSEEVVNQIGRLYRMKVLPTLDQLKKALEGMNIDLVENAGAKIALTGLMVADLSGISAFASGWKLLKEGISILRKRVKYKKDKEKVLTSSPYSYLYRTQGFRKHG